MPVSHAPSTQRDDAGRSGSAPEFITRLAGLGPFFAVRPHAPGAGPAGRWRPVDELVRPGAALDARVRRVRGALAARGGRSPERIEPRVAVSVAQLGLVARLIAPAIGAAALGAKLPGDAASLWWQDELGGPYPVSVAVPPAATRAVPPAVSPAVSPAAAPAGAPVATAPVAPSTVPPVPTAGPEAGPDAAAHAGPGPLAGSAIEAITRACLAGYSVSPRVLWGNVASAAVSAAGLVGAAVPDLAAAARDAADAMLADGRVEAGALRSGPGFRRRSCCLIYRPAGSTAAVCGDCVLRS